MADQRREIQSNLLGETVRFPIHGGGRSEGKIRAVYLSTGGSVMLLIQDGRDLVVVSADSAKVG